MSHCPVGMARSQTDPTLTACLTKEQNLRMECVFIPTKQANATCTFEVDKKVVATNVANKQQDPTYTNRASIKLESNKCVLNLKGLTDDSKTFNCTVQQEKLASAKMTVEKSKIYIYIYGPRVSQVN